MRSKKIQRKLKYFKFIIFSPKANRLGKLQFLYTFETTNMNEMLIISTYRWIFLQNSHLKLDRMNQKINSRLPEPAKQTHDWNDCYRSKRHAMMWWLVLIDRRYMYMCVWPLCKANNFFTIMSLQIFQFKRRNIFGIIFYFIFLVLATMNV